MCEFILTKYDVSGIQSYIFATNRLQENVGASHNVTRILRDFLNEALQEAFDEVKKEVIEERPEAGSRDMGETDNQKLILDWENEQSQPLAIRNNPYIAAEVIYIGGGNAVVVYRDRNLCRITDMRFAWKVTENCQGISVLAAHMPTGLKDFKQDMAALNARLSASKSKVPRTPVLSPYPIVEQDSTYGLPITKLLEDGKIGVSGVQYEKRIAYKHQTDDNRTPSPYGKYIPGQFSFAFQVEDLVKKRGEDSYIAVVHIDGNGMGNLIEKSILQNIPYENAVQEMRKISSAVSSCYSEVFSQIMKGVYANSQQNKKDDGKTVLPVRPLINDGDDITFLCSASLALPLAASFLRRLMSMSFEGFPLTACAGIAYVHSHFPFKIAYGIAEQCCGEAKKKWYENCGNNNMSVMAGYLDYHLVRGAYIKGMEDQRKEKDIRKRPYLVGKGPEKERSDSIDSLFEICRKMTEESCGTPKWPRNRLKRIYETYLTDPADLEFLEKEFSSRGMEMSDLAGMTPDNFCASEACGIFDALEVLDFYEENTFKTFMGNCQGAESRA